MEIHAVRALARFWPDDTDENVGYATDEDSAIDLALSYISDRFSPDVNDIAGSIEYPYDDRIYLRAFILTTRFEDGSVWENHVIYNHNRDMLMDIMIDREPVYTRSS